MSLKSPLPLVNIPQGFKSYITNAGIKDETTDLGVVHSEVPCAAAAVFTRNKVPGNPILVGKKHIQSGKIQTVVVNSKNSNVATGQDGYNNSLRICKMVGRELNMPVNHVFPSSTGVIGRPLPVEKMEKALENLTDNLQSPADFMGFATAIMTTDTFPKFASMKVGNAVIVGVAKGSGMIEPDMATMLSYFFTDARIQPAVLKKILRKVADSTFNSLSVDSDMSTSDTCLIMANGLAGKVHEKEFEEALMNVAVSLTRYLARDGEGATKLFIVRVTGAVNDLEARKIAKSIINSPLVKTAIYKGDPNWGRIFMAIGKTPGVKVNPSKIVIEWGGKTYSNNELCELSQYLNTHEELHLTVHLGLGKGEWQVYGCDLTEDYVKINAYYTT